MRQKGNVMTYTQALTDATRVSLAMSCRIAILYGGVDWGHDWIGGEHSQGGFDVPSGWKIVSVIDRGQLESRG